MRRYFLDTEFNQEVEPIQLISLGLVCEDGREFYAVSNEFDEPACDDWLQQHVLPNLRSLPGPDYISRGGEYFCGRLECMRIALENFLGADKNPVFYGYYSAYDFYLFSRLWGFLKMPEHFPKYCIDLKQALDHLNWNDWYKKPAVLQPEHHALVDARWNRLLFDSIVSAMQRNEDFSGKPAPLYLP